MKKNKKMKILTNMICAGVTPSHASAESQRLLMEKGYLPLEMKGEWKLEQGGRYLIMHHNTTLLAFSVGEHARPEEGVRMAAAHTDVPCFRIKGNPEMASGGYGQVNVEVYGGPILNTWLDRPLSIAGRVALRGKDAFHPQVVLVDFKRPLLTIPNLAIHMNREVNKGVELNRQTELLPILTMLPEKYKSEKFFMELLAKECQVRMQDILEYELCLYCAEDPAVLGMNEEFYTAPRLDNLTSVTGLVIGLLEGERKEGVNLIALFDHEEIGNKSKQGAASLLLRDVCERISRGLGATEEEVQRAVYDSMLLSVDVAHALHPNYTGKMDPTNHPVLGKGLCIKEASSQSYATDCGAVAVIAQLCQEKEIPFQKFYNRSDSPGGGTLGAVASTLMPVKAVDIGIPLLAMHSAREMMGVDDMEALTQCVTEFFRYSVEHAE